MASKFERFETFGVVGNNKSRKLLATNLSQYLHNHGTGFLSKTNTDLDSYHNAIDEIVSNPSLKHLCSKDERFTEIVTQEILDFINRTSKIINKSENPVGREYLALTDFKQISKSAFSDEWKKVKTIINKKYTKNEIDICFYNNEFNRSLEKKKKNNRNSISFDGVKKHFIEKWSELLLERQNKWEIDLIDQERKMFCEDLYKRLENFNKIRELLEPFEQQLGRLWDLSKGNWHRVDFDILQRYTILLQRDKSLQELAEMLGRMQKAEKALEEELLSKINLKPEWKAVHASKADLIGIHESDDLSSSLPSETALLAEDILQSVFFKKFAEKKLQTFEYQAKVLSFREEDLQIKHPKAETNGPFIICIDTSGSMHGTPENVAKTLCFAILKMAIRDNRKCYLISFSNGVQTLNLTDLNTSIDKLVAFLSMSFHGGTDATPAMNEALRMLETDDYKKADVIMVSDFIMSAFDKNTQIEIKSAKLNQTKFHSLVIGPSHNPSIIQDFDNSWFYDLKNRNSILTLVQNINKL